MRSCCDSFGRSVENLGRGRRRGGVALRVGGGEGGGEGTGAAVRRGAPVFEGDAGVEDLVDLQHEAPRELLVVHALRGRSGSGGSPTEAGAVVIWETEQRGATRLLACTFVGSRPAPDTFMSLSRNSAKTRSAWAGGEAAGGVNPFVCLCCSVSLDCSVGSSVRCRQEGGLACWSAERESKFGRFWRSFATQALSQSGLRNRCIRCSADSSAGRAIV